MRILYCSKCGEENYYKNSSLPPKACGDCMTRLDDPRIEGRHRWAYPDANNQPRAIPCSSPRCLAVVYFHSPLEDNSHQNPNTPKAQSNKMAVRQQVGVYCWKCGQHVEKLKSVGLMTSVGFWFWLSVILVFALFFSIVV